VNGNFEHAIRFETHFGDTKGAYVLFNLDYPVIAVEENEIQSIQHTDGVNPV
jgi:hypothetical protein